MIICRLKLLATLCIILLIASCGTTTPSTFYLMTVRETPQEINISSQTKLSDRVIIVGPLSLPEYLNRNQIVRLEADGQLQVNEFHRWAEPLRDNLLRLVTSHLSEQLKSDQVLRAGGLNPRKYDYKILIDVTRFEMINHQQVILEGHWLLVDGRDVKEFKPKRIKLNVDVADNKYSTLITAHETLIRQFSHNIGEALLNLQP